MKFLLAALLLIPSVSFAWSEEELSRAYDHYQRHHDDELGLVEMNEQIRHDDEMKIEKKKLELMQRQVELQEREINERKMDLSRDSFGNEVPSRYRFQN